LQLTVPRVTFEHLNDRSYIFPNARIEKRVVIFPYCVIGRPPMSPNGTTNLDYDQDMALTRIGEGTIIGASSVIYSGVTIGKNCLIGDGVKIRESVNIGDNCIIGMNTKVGARTTIGERSKIMDLTNVASDTQIEAEVFIGPGVMMGNDNRLGHGEFHNRRGVCGY